MEKLQRDAHISEAVGAEYWAEKLKEEILELDDLQEQIVGLKG